ncbi:MAG: heat-inducible transcriptional repressor HrcA [Clostridia bacterium]|nr:heat-inducible transcriptional repressor HrcA [Clostridia bacterium]
MFLDDMLDERKKRILRAIIDDYIGTAEPVGSRTIARKHELGLSSATIRNEMADLEEMGFLAQPHSSAGRVPSDKGYRLYVDHLMELNELPVEDIEGIKSAMEVKINELSQLIRQASMVMSRITRYTSLATTPQLKKSTFKAVQVVPIETGKALVIVVTDAGVVRNCLIRIPDAILPDFLIKVSNLLNEKLVGLTLGQVDRKVVGEIQDEIIITKELLMPILKGIAECISQIDSHEVFLDGTTNIFNYPEFRDIIKAKEFLSFLDQKEILCGLLESNLPNDSVVVKIGAENCVDGIKECSLVKATYSLGDVVIGSIGVIGPTRMEYPRVISSMNYIKKKINQELKKLVEGNTE